MEEKKKNQFLNQKIKKLTKELNDEMNKSNNLVKLYKEYQEKFNEEKKSNTTLKQKIELLKIELNELKNNKVNNKNDNKDNNNDNIEDSKIIEKKETFCDLYNKIKVLEQKLARYPIELSEGENLISIIFTSMDQNIHCSLVCKDTEKFCIVESRLYERYPNYMESENYFIINGSKINRFKSLKENKINNSDIIILYKI